MAQVTQVAAVAVGTVPLLLMLVVKVVLVL